VFAVVSASSTAKRKRRTPQPPPPNDKTNNQKHVVIVGGGAAGLTAAIFAAREAAAAAEDAPAPPPPRVIVLERTSEPGKKILLSGGTRANVLPLTVTPEADFSTDSRPSALRSALAAWPLEDVKEFLEGDVGLGPLALERESNKFFPASNSSQDVRDGLVRAALREGAEVRCGVKVSRIERRRTSGERRWRLWIDSEEGERDDQPTFVDADSVVLALGGSSFPKMGTDGMGYRMLSRLGVPLKQPYPALTPLTGAHPAGEQLAGVTLPEARLTAVVAPSGDAAAEDEANGQETPTATKKKKKKKAAAALGASRRGGFLFSHKGYTGPAVLDVSEHWVRSGGGGAGGNEPQTTAAPPPTTTMRVAWTGEGEGAWAERLKSWSGGAHVVTLLQRSGVPQRLATALCRESAVPEDGSVPVSRLPKNAARLLARLLGAYELPVEGHRGYALAEVTGGGVPLEALDTRTMEVVKVVAVEGAKAKVGGGGGGGDTGDSDGGDDDHRPASESPSSSTAARSGLHVCGELVDVHGRIGGFNFLWAWVSGRSAGKGAVASALRAENGD
jgi:predicted flavoprotein YhiN